MTNIESKQPVQLSDAGAEHDVVERAQEDLREGKSASTAAGEFVREEIDHVREGKHGARSAKQAIAIGLSKARRAGVPLGTPKPGTVPESTRKQAVRESKAGPKRQKPSKKRSRAAEEALEREPRSTVSAAALSKQAKSAAKRRQKRGTTVTGRTATSARKVAKRASRARKSAKSGGQHAAR